MFELCFPIKKLALNKGLFQFVTFNNGTFYFQIAHSNNENRISVNTLNIGIKRHFRRNQKILNLSLSYHDYLFFSDTQKQTAHQFIHFRVLRIVVFRYITNLCAIMEILRNH